MCKNEVEDEKHFLISCPMYNEKRKSLFERLEKELKISIKKMTTDKIFLLLLNPPSNNGELQKIIAKQCQNSFAIMSTRCTGYEICCFWRTWHSYERVYYKIYFKIVN